MRWLDSITDSTDMNLSKLWETVKDGDRACCSPWGHKEWEYDLVTEQQQSNEKLTLKNTKILTPGGDSTKGLTHFKQTRSTFITEENAECKLLPILWERHSLSTHTTTWDSQQSLHAGKAGFLLTLSYGEETHCLKKLSKVPKVSLLPVATC